MPSTFWHVMNACCPVPFVLAGTTSKSVNVSPSQGAAVEQFNCATTPPYAPLVVPWKLLKEMLLYVKVDVYK